MSKVLSLGANSKCGVQSKRKHESHESCGVCIAGFSAMVSIILLSLSHIHTLTHSLTHTLTHTPRTTTQKPCLCLSESGAIATRSLRLQHALRTPAPREEMRTASIALSVLLSVSNLCTGQQSVNSGTH